jgi:serine/threonine protein phosphatase 1
MKKFVIGDIHGNRKGLIQCLERSGFDYENDQLITLGDIVDRGPETYECIEELLKIKNRIDIKGNHDYIWEEWIHTGNHRFGWSHGAISTVRSYCDYSENEMGFKKFIKQGHKTLSTNLTRADIPLSHINFFKNQNYYHVDNENRCFVHGGFNRHESIEHQDEDILLWDRDLVMASKSFKQMKGQDYKFKILDDFKEVYVGHTPTIMWEGDTTPQFNAQIIMMDTGGAYPEGKVTIMNIETKEYFQSDLGSTLYDNFSR